MAEAAGRALIDSGVDALVAEVRAGKRKSIARLMSLAESNGAMASRRSPNCIAIPAARMSSV